MGIIRQKRKAETRALLLQAGLGVFAERGIEFATLDDIAQTAGFTKGAIYRQFPSKGAFLLALFEQYAAVLRRIPATSLRLPTGPIPDTWDDVVEHSVPLEKHFEGCGGLTLTEEMKVTIAATWGGVLSEEYERLRGDAEHDRQWALDGYG